MSVHKTLSIALASFYISSCSSYGPFPNSTGAVLSLFESNNAEEISWLDGGFIGETPFRLRDVDAAEISPVGASIGGAQCENERIIGMDAERFMALLTNNATLHVSSNYGPDAFERYVIDLSANNVDVAQAGLNAGLLKPWPHDDNGNPFIPKPSWCSI